MAAESPTCSRLFVSWLCVMVAIALMGRYGNVGWLGALLPMGIAMKIRAAHDKALFDRLRESGAWQRIAAIYYVVLLFVVMMLVLQGHRIDRYPFYVEAIVLLLPGFACMGWNDLSTCKQRKSNVP